ncbi:MAG: hypothetical protein SGCHY_002534 [Lobulomycetales sp.]
MAIVVKTSVPFNDIPTGSHVENVDPKDCIVLKTTKSQIKKCSMEDGHYVVPMEIDVTTPGARASRGRLSDAARQRLHRERMSAGKKEAVKMQNSQQHRSKRQNMTDKEKGLEKVTTSF